MSTSYFKPQSPHKEGHHITTSDEGPWYCGACFRQLDRGLSFIPDDDHVLGLLPNALPKEGFSGYLVKTSSFRASVGRGCRMCRALYTLIVRNAKKKIPTVDESNFWSIYTDPEKEYPDRGRLWWRFYESVSLALIADPDANSNGHTIDPLDVSLTLYFEIFSPIKVAIDGKIRTKSKIIFWMQKWMGLSLRLVSTDGRDFNEAYNSWERLVNAFEMPEDSASHGSLTTAMFWLEKCRRSHAKCHASGTVRLPSRLLRIRVTAGPAYEVRLIDTKGKSGRYFSLSHCWGFPVAPRLEAVKTTMANLESQKEYIPFDSLPKTFQDALLFTHRFGIEYLWIDSLCIIQDSHEDWVFEASQMAAVYSQSLLTLHATRGDNSESGLYAVLPQEYASIAVPAAEETSSYSVVRRVHKHFSDSDQHYKLMTRGWCYQENMLSPRSLHFTRKGLNWECLMGSWCECHGRIRGAHSKHNSSPFASADQSYVETRYHGASSRYNSLALTNSTDKLPAFGGIARAFTLNHPKKFNGKYLAGLWESRLPDDLFWELKSIPEHGVHRPQPWRAPSWSWAATDMAHDTYKRNGLDGSEKGLPAPALNPRILESSQHSEGSDEFGQILSAHLVVAAKLISGKMDSGANYYYFNPVLDPGNSPFPFFKFTPDYNLFDPGPDYISGNRAYMMTLFFDKTLRKVPEETKAPFLVLVKNEKEGHYVRVGCGEIVMREPQMWALLERQGVETTFVFK